jgi:hypothetical protein
MAQSFTISALKAKTAQCATTTNIFGKTLDKGFISNVTCDALYERIERHCTEVFTPSGAHCYGTSFHLFVTND